MREYEQRGPFHERCQPNCRPGVIAEDEKRGAVWAKLGEAKPIYDRGHGMFADTKVQILSARSVRLEISGSIEGQQGFVRRTEISGATQEPGNILREHVQRFPRSVASSDAFGVGRKHGQVPIPSGRKLAPLHEFNLKREIRKLGAVRPEHLGPLATSFQTARSNSGVEVLVDTVRNVEFCVFGPAVEALA